MSHRVDSDKIEAIVGIERHKRNHYARAVTNKQMVYVLHSHRCFNTNPDLDCSYTQALDNGIDLDEWAGFEDKPVRVMVSWGCLVPYESLVRELGV